MLALAQVLCLACLLCLGAVPCTAAPETATTAAPAGAGDPFQQALYAACLADWKAHNWQRLAGPRALAAGGRDPGEVRCFAERGRASIEAAVEAALAACRAVYGQGCSIFAENRSLAFWAQDIADSYRHLTRDASERQYIRCSRPGLWERYATAEVPVVMVVGRQDGDYRCYWAADKTFADATARALGFCQNRGSADCETFAAGGHLREKFLRAGDRLHGAKRSEYEYLYRACLDPATVEAYRAMPAASGADRLLWAEWQEKAAAAAGGERYQCRMQSVTTGPVAAEAALAKDCHSRGVECLAVAYDMTLQPWAKATGDRLDGHYHDDAYYMLYACAMYDAEENLDSTPPHRVLLGLHAKGEPRFDCLWQFGAPSKQAAVAKLPCEHGRYDCRLVASDGVLEAPFRAHLHAPAKAGVPHDMLDGLAPGGADAPTLWPPGLLPPELAVDGAPPEPPGRRPAIAHGKAPAKGTAPAAANAIATKKAEH